VSGHESFVQDVGLSKDLNESFRKHLSNTGDTLDVDFSIQVSTESGNLVAAYRYKGTTTYLPPGLSSECASRTSLDDFTPDGGGGGWKWTLGKGKHVNKVKRLVSEKLDAIDQIVKEIRSLLAIQGTI
jgi:hypothetical protein